MARSCVYTLVKDARFHLPQWIKYYSQHFDLADMYILDHNSQDVATRQILGDFGGNVRYLDYATIFDHEWLRNVVQDMQRELLERYEYVLFTDADEIVIPATGTLKSFIDHANQSAYRCTGYEVLEGQMHRHPFFDKTLLSTHPLQWCYGYHNAEPEYPVSDELFLYHLHKMNFDEAWQKNMRWANYQFDATAIANGHSFQNQIRDIDAFKGWFYDTSGEQLEGLHERIVREIDCSV